MAALATAATAGASRTSNGSGTIYSFHKGHGIQQRRQHYIAMQLVRIQIPEKPSHPPQTVQFVTMDSPGHP